MRLPAITPVVHGLRPHVLSFKDVSDAGVARRANAWQAVADFVDLLGNGPPVGHPDNPRQPEYLLILNAWSRVWAAAVQGRQPSERQRYIAHQMKNISQGAAR